MRVFFPSLPSEPFPYSVMLTMIPPRPMLINCSSWIPKIFDLFLNNSPIDIKRISFPLWRFVCTVGRLVPTERVWLLAFQEKLNPVVTMSAAWLRLCPPLVRPLAFYFNYFPCIYQVYLTLLNKPLIHHDHFSYSF